MIALKAGHPKTGANSAIEKAFAMPFPALAPALRALVVWLLIILAESLLGGLRRSLVPPDHAFVIRQASVLVSLAMIFAICWMTARWLRMGSDAAALALGSGWACLTLAFEIGFGRAAGASWSRILSDYDLAHGGLMPLGLAGLAITPWVVRRLRLRSV